MSPAVLARLEREYGMARPLTGLEATIAALVIGAAGAVELVDCGEVRVVAVDADGREVLYDLKAVLR